MVARRNGAKMLVHWLATAFVMGLGGLLLLMEFVPGMGVIHADAQLAVLIVGVSLLAAGFVNRPRKQG